jgi:uncharacterized protein (TIGR03437 family)
VGFSGVNLLTSQIARISTSALNPFSTQTVTASSGGAFELADVSVTIGGEAVKILSVSPTELMTVVPATLGGGLTEIVVSSREGFILHGTASVNGLKPSHTGCGRGHKRTGRCD